jgi:hypothetical protein
LSPTGRTRHLPQGDGDKKADRRGEHGISRKTIACGNAGVFPVTRCEYSCAYLLPHAHTRLRVHRAPGIPHALSFPGGGDFLNLGRVASRECGGVFHRHCEKRSDETIHAATKRKNGLLRCARNDVGCGSPPPLRGRRSWWAPARLCLPCAATPRSEERPLPRREPRRGFRRASRRRLAAGRTGVPARWRGRTFWSAKIRPTGRRRTATAT